MSELKVNKITPKTGTSIQLGESGDTITIPCGATLTNNGTATGFGLSFCTTVKTTSFTATANKGFFINTGSAVTVTLPASPSTGDEVIIVDQTGQASSNNITLGRNGSKIKGGCNDLLLATDRGGLRLVYSGSSQGWITATAGNDATATPQYMSASGGTETTCGNFKIHTFTSDGTFTVNRTAASSPDNAVDYLVAAGGGGGAAQHSGGGGAGGLRFSATTYTAPPTSSPIASPAGITVTAQAYPITIGGGGAARPGISSPSGACSQGNSGNNSVFSTITSTAGGGGGGYGSAPRYNGLAGGSGGGAGSINGSGGSGNTPPVSPPQGNDGGDGAPSIFTGGGGGGAGAVGSDAGPPQAGNGGVGLQVNINGTGHYWSGGGGGGSESSRTGGNGGLGGGGGGGAMPSGTQGTGGGSALNSGANASSGNGGAGGTNTGGGGGASGSNDTTGATGGSGIVIIRYRYQ
jgi:hypothetical protein